MLLFFTLAKKETKTSGLAVFGNCSETSFNSFSYVRKTEDSESVGSASCNSIDHLLWSKLYIPSTIKTIKLWSGSQNGNLNWSRFRSVFTVLGIYNFGFDLHSISLEDRDGWILFCIFQERASSRIVYSHFTGCILSFEKVQIESKGLFSLFLDTKY